MQSIQILHFPELLFLKAITSLCLTGYLLYQWQGSERRPHKSCVAKVGFLVLATDQTEAETTAATIYSRTFSTKNLQKLQAISTFLFQSQIRWKLSIVFVYFWLKMSYCGLWRPLSLLLSDKQLRFRQYFCLCLFWI